MSTSPWDSLNLGLNVDDDPQHVAQNRSRLAAALGRSVVFMEQVHGSRVAEVDDIPADTVMPVADAMITSRTDIALGVLVADCVPVLLADKTSPLGAVVHAGRKGVMLDIVDATVVKLRERGAQRLVAAIGPSICGRCYEVPEAMQGAVTQTIPAAYATTRAGTTGLDLPAAVRAQLESAGVEDINDLGICTMEDERFYSHRGRLRKRQRVTGRFAGFIAV